MIRGYYLTDIADRIAFPVAERLESNPDERDTLDINLQAERGRKYNYTQAEFGIWSLVFRVTDTQLEFFKTLHAAVKGRETPFYLVLDMDGSPLESLLVRMQQKLSKRFVAARRRNGQTIRMWDVPLELTEEVDSELEIEE